MKKFFLLHPHLNGINCTLLNFPPFFVKLEVFSLLLLKILCSKKERQTMKNTSNDKWLARILVFFQSYKYLSKPRLISFLFSFWTEKGCSILPNSHLSQTNKICQISRRKIRFKNIFTCEIWRFGSFYSSMDAAYLKNLERLVCLLGIFIRSLPRFLIRSWENWKFFEEDY